MYTRWEFFKLSIRRVRSTPLSVIFPNTHIITFIKISTPSTFVRLFWPMKWFNTTHKLKIYTFVVSLLYIYNKVITNLQASSKFISIYTILGLPILSIIYIISYKYVINRLQMLKNPISYPFHVWTFKPLTINTKSTKTC